jgi:hypothetical protein
VVGALEDQEHRPENTKYPGGPKNSTFRDWLLGSSGIVVAGHLTALAVLAYPAGLITLWIQLTGYYGFDYWTALHAASLVPTTVVVGKIATVFCFSMLTNAVVFGWSIRVWGYKEFHRGLYNIAGNPLGLEDPDNPIGGGKTTLGQYMFSMERFLAIGITLLLPTMIFPLFVPTTWFNVGILVAFMLLVIAGSYATTPLVLKAAEQESRPKLYKGIVVAYAAAVLAAVPLAGLGSPALQTVEITSEGQKREVAVLAHADGYWHVIDHNNTLTYMPDDEVEGSVTITGVTQKPGY